MIHLKDDHWPFQRERWHATPSGDHRGGVLCDRHHLPRPRRQVALPGGLNFLEKVFFCQHHHCSTSTASATWAPSATSAPATEELESARKKCRGESLYLPTGYKERIKITWGTNWLLKLETRRCSGQRESLALRTVPLSPRTPLRWDGLFFNVYKS